MAKTTRSQKKRQLSGRQRLFAAEYCKDFNATAAAKRAGYSAKTAGSQGHDHLKKPEIQKLVRQFAQRNMAKVEVEGAAVISQLARFAFANLHDYMIVDPETGEPRLDLTGIERENLGALAQITWHDDGSLKSVKLPSRERALEQLGRYLNLEPPQKIEIEGKLETSEGSRPEHSISDAELRARIEEIAARNVEK